MVCVGGLGRERGIRGEMEGAGDGIQGGRGVIPNFTTWV